MANLFHGNTFESPRKVDGTVNSGGLVYFYKVGTSELKNTYSDNALTTAHANPVVLDTYGRKTIYLQGKYKVRVETSAGVLIEETAVVNDNNTLKDSDRFNKVVNGDFEDTTVSSTLPDEWTITLYTGGTGVIDSTDRHSGVKSLKFTSTGTGGGYAVTDNFIACSPDIPVNCNFSIKSSAADVRNLVEVLWYTSAQVLDSTTTLYDDSTTNPTSWTAKSIAANPPSTAYYCKLRLTGCHSSDATTGSTWFDNVALTNVSQVAVQAATSEEHAAQLQQVTHENGIVNGALLVWQDGTSFTSVANATYIADNLKYLKVATAVHDAARVADSTSAAAPGMVFDRARLTLTTAQASMAAGDYCALRMYVEGYQWRRYKADQFTLQFLVKLPLAGTYCYSIQNSAADYSYVGELAYATANTDQLITVTVPTPPAGTWLFDGGIGAQLSIVLASGTTYGSGVVGWQTGNHLATVNQVNSLNVATTSTYELALMRIDAGPVARPWSVTDFDHGITLAKCQAYYRILGGDAANSPMITETYVDAAVRPIYLSILFPKMRAVPTATVYGSWGLVNATTPTVNSVSQSSVVLRSDSGGAAGLAHANANSTSGVKLSARY